MTTQKAHGQVKMNTVNLGWLSVHSFSSYVQVYIAVCVTVEYDMLYSIVKGVFEILSISS